MARWIRDNLPYSELIFHLKLTAFNIAWRDVPRKSNHSYVAPRGRLTKPGFENHEYSHAERGSRDSCAPNRWFPETSHKSRSAP